MSFELVMPKLGLTNTEGTIAAWVVSEGAPVKKGDVILEVETEKTTVDVESPADGILHIVVEKGIEVKVGERIGYLAADNEEYEAICNGNLPEKAEDTTGAEKPASEKASQAVAIPEAAISASEKAASAALAAAGVSAGRVKASPLARKIASKAGIDLSLVTGTGPGGRIVSRDVEQFFETTVAANLTAPGQAVPAAHKEPVRIPLTATRKTIARRMYESLKSMAQTSDSVEIDVTDLMKLRKKLAAREAELGTKITMNDLLAMATVKMLKKHPLANAELTDNEIITYPYVHLSVAVATEHGLTSPVIKNADSLSLIQLSKALKEIIDRARANRLTMDDLTGGTCTITNMGIFPVDTFNPIINPPQSAILGFGRAVEKPAVVEGQISIRTMMSISITFDHRVFDGAEAGSIFKDMKEYLENPELILL